MSILDSLDALWNCLVGSTIAGSIWPLFKGFRKLFYKQKEWSSEKRRKKVLELADMINNILDERENRAPDESA